MVSATIAGAMGIFTNALRSCSATKLIGRLENWQFSRGGGQNVHCHPDTNMMPDSGNSQDQFHQIVEAAPSAIIMIDMVGRVEMVNGQAEQMFGYDRNEIVGQPIQLLVPEWFSFPNEKTLDTFLDGSRAHSIGARRDLYALRKDGTRFPVETGLNPVRTGDGAMVVLAIVDISIRKQAEERLHAALLQKDNLLGEIHHRVKNNLQIVYSLLDLQSTRVSDPAALEMLRESRNRIQSMALIHQTLYGSKDFAKVDFAMFTGTLLSSLRESYGTDMAGIAVQIDVDPIKFPIDTAVPCGLVVNELITNAVKHAFRDRHRGEIRVALIRLPGNEAQLSVSDDGRGLPDHVDTQKTTTLGLQLVGLLAHQMSGTVSINRSNPTRFSVRFPI
jgi:PAS domain S-box-containing protein